MAVAGSRVLGSNGTENSLKDSGDLDHRIGTGSGADKLHQELRPGV
jgi:hypothetical protein